MNKVFAIILKTVIGLLLIFGIGYFIFYKLGNNNNGGITFNKPVYTVLTESVILSLEPFSDKKISFDMMAYTDHLDSNKVKLDKDTGLIYYDYPEPYSNDDIIRIFTLSKEMDLEENLWVKGVNWSMDENGELLRLVKKYCNLRNDENEINYWFDVGDNYDQESLKIEYPEYHFGPFGICPNHVKYTVFKEEDIVVVNWWIPMDASDIHISKDINKSNLRIID